MTDQPEFTALSFDPATEPVFSLERHPLITVTIDDTKRAGTSRDAPIIAEFTVEVGTPSLAIKGTFHEWLNHPRGQAFVVDRPPLRAKPQSPLDQKFADFLTVCCLYTFRASREELQTAIFDQLDRKLNPQQ